MTIRRGKTVIVRKRLRPRRIGSAGGSPARAISPLAIRSGICPISTNKGTDHPTAVAMLKVIERKEITLTRAEFNGQRSLHLSPLPDWLPDVLRYLHLSSTLYADLQKNSAFDISIFGK